MDYKILEVNILCNHPHDDHIISVAIESAPGHWKAYYKQMDEISEKSVLEVARTGSKYPKRRALELFGSCRQIELLQRHVYED